MQRKKPTKRLFKGLAGSPLAAPSAPVGRPRKFKNDADKQQQHRNDKVIVEISFTNPDKDRLTVVNELGVVQSVTSGGFDTNKLIRIEDARWKGRNNVRFPKSWNLENAVQREIIRAITLDQITPEPKGNEYFYLCNHCGQGLNFIEQSTRHMMDEHSAIIKKLLRARIPKKTQRNKEAKAEPSITDAVEHSKQELKRDHDYREFRNAKK